MVTRFSFSFFSFHHGIRKGMKFSTSTSTSTSTSSTSTSISKRRLSKVQHHAVPITVVTLGSGGSCSFRNGRKQACTAVNLPYGHRTWIFDCGEAALMESHPNVKDHDIRRIFLTHLHGDHIFGLPGLMARVNLHEQEGLKAHKFIAKGEPLEIVGPHGIANFVRTALSVSKMQMKFPWRIVELRHGAPAVGSPDALNLNTNLLKNEMPMEIIKPNQEILEKEKRFVWNLPGADLDESGHVKDFDVVAAEIKHTKNMPSIGYVLQEPTLPRNLVIEKIRTHLDLHKEWLVDTLGDDEAKKIKKTLTHSKTKLELPSGVVIDSGDPDSKFFGPIRPGRKICILGDTSNAQNISNEAFGADLLIHECTYMDDQSRDARLRGHSTPKIAGEFAKRVKAKRLLLNHAGTKINANNKKICQIVVSSANRAMGSRKNSVWLASDNDVYSLPVIVLEAGKEALDVESCD